MTQSAIGIFDSGIGGLSVLQQLQSIKPKQDFIYLSDHANMPYGNKTAKQIQDYSLAICRWLESRGVSLIISACHTSSIIAVDLIRSQINVPIIGMHTALAAFLKEHRYRSIAMLATPLTVSHGGYPSLIKRLGIDCQIDMLPCPGLVELIESKQTATIQRYLNKNLGIVNDNDYDGIVLGCTHYELVKQAICLELNHSINCISIDHWLKPHVHGYLDAFIDCGGRVTYYRTNHGQIQLTPCPTAVQSHRGQGVV